MDRFIGSNYDVKYEGQDSLKSNMDRFIDSESDLTPLR